MRENQSDGELKSARLLCNLLLDVLYTLNQAAWEALIDLYGLGGCWVSSQYMSPPLP